MQETTREQLVHEAVPVGCFLPGRAEGEIGLRKSDNANTEQVGTRKINIANMKMTLDDNVKEYVSIKGDMCIEN